MGSRVDLPVLLVEADLGPKTTGSALPARPLTRPAPTPGARFELPGDSGAGLAWGEEERKGVIANVSPRV